MWCFMCGNVFAESIVVQSIVPVKQCSDGLCTTRYLPSYFYQYKPLNAFDMVNRLPGFSLTDSDDTQRGFAENAGNVLFNDERASTKSESLEDLLNQIPADDVIRIDVLTGRLGELALPGQSIVANVIRNKKSRSGIWELRGRFHSPDYSLRQSANLVYNDTIKNVGLSSSLLYGRYRGRTESDRSFFDAPNFEQLDEERFEVFDESGWITDWSMALNAEIFGWRVNTNIGYLHRDEFGGNDSIRRDFRDEVQQSRFFFPDGDIFKDTDFGIDVEKKIDATNAIKLITIISNREFDEVGGVIDTTLPNEAIVERESSFNTLGQERIARIEWNNTWIKGHNVKISIENALNKLDSRFGLTSLENNELVPVFVPGANTIVKENRADLRLLDSFTVGSVGVEAGIAIERSTIEQEGGFTDSRDFSYFKPNLSLSYKTKNNASIRFDYRRIVSQLDFFDFASNADLDQDELELGNPTLEPEKTDRFEFQYEHQFAGSTAVNIKLFYDDVSDALDTLILSETLEAVGNIGDASRFGIDSAFTLPVEFLGIKNGRLDIELDWQDTKVTDPLSGESREIGDTEHWQMVVNFRQELPRIDAFWGLSYLIDDDRFFFGADELSRSGRDELLDLYFEKRLNNGLRIYFSVENLFEGGDPIDRQVFNGNRFSGILAQREFSVRSFTREIFVRVSKSF